MRLSSSPVRRVAIPASIVVMDVAVTAAFSADVSGARDATPPEAVAEHGGQKCPAVVLAGHRVTVELPFARAGSASLLYADDTWRLPDGPHPSVTGTAP